MIADLNTPLSWNRLSPVCECCGQSRDEFVKLMAFNDGNRGTITYREIALETLFKENDFDDVMYLLLWETLPSPEQKREMQRKLAQHLHAPEAVHTIVNTSP
jgi:citrate synthase